MCLQIATHYTSLRLQLQPHVNKQLNSASKDPPAITAINVGWEVVMSNSWDLVHVARTIEFHQFPARLPCILLPIDQHDTLPLRAKAVVNALALEGVP